MIFKDGVDELLRRVDKASADSKSKADCKAKLNFAYREVAKASLWKDLESFGEVAVKAVYDTGTATIVKGSRSVVLTGSTLTADMAYRFFCHSNSSSWYRIISVNVATSTLGLETEISEESASGLTFTIWKKFYRINTNTRVVLPDYDLEGMPLPFEVHGCDDPVSDVSPTVTASEGSRDLTCSGATLLGNVFRGDLIDLEGSYSRVKSVDSDVKITMLNASGSSFQGTANIRSETPLYAVLSGHPSSNYLKSYAYIRRVYDMIHDTDRTELSDDFDMVIFDFAKAEYKRDKNASGWQDDMLVANARLEAMKNNPQYVKPAFKTFALNVKQGMGRGE